MLLDGNPVGVAKVKKFEPFITERLLVREFVPADMDALLAFVRDPGQLKYMLFNLSTEADLDGFMSESLEQQTEGDRATFHLAVCERGDKTSACVGCVSLMRESADSPEAEIGYFFLKDRWGRGYAVEAALPVIEFGFSGLKLHRVWGKCHSLNTGSARVMEKLGMAFEGTMREHAWMGDHWRSSRLYSVLDREWAARE